MRAGVTWRVNKHFTIRGESRTAEYKEKVFEIATSNDSPRAFTSALLHEETAKSHHSLLDLQKS